MTDGRPRFSVVIPAFDQSPTIAATVRTALAQRDVSFEVVVVDDGSTDGTLASLGSLAEDPRLRTIRQPNSGVSAARNAGARQASGAFVTFLDCDDEVEPDWLAAFEEVLTPDALVAFGGAERRRRDGTSIVLAPEPQGPVGDDLVAAWFPGTFAVHRGLFADVGGYCVALRFSENTELGWRLTDEITRRGGATVFHRRPTYIWNVPAVGESLAWSDEARLESALYIVAHHRARLARDPAQLASYQAIAGVAAARSGRGALARRQFVRAWQARPADLRNGARLAAAMLAPVRQRVWAPAGPAT